MADVWVPKAALTPPRKGGSAELFEMRNDAASRGVEIVSHPDGSRTYKITELDEFTFPEAQYLEANAGCVVTDYPMVLEMADRTALVPDGIPHRMEPADPQADPPTAERVRTWDEWSLATGDPKMAAVQFGSSWYIHSYRTSIRLTVAQLTIAEASGVTLKTREEFQAIREAHSPSPV